MPKINLNHQTDLSKQACFEKLKELFENDSDLKKLDPGYKCDFDDSNHKGTAKGSQFKAQMKVKEAGGKSEVEIEVDLPFHLGLVKGMVQKTLEKKLKSSLTS